ncbi:hypothetical protein KHP62_03875 [Rhodobacteraceae bacterium NNCM2]|nr:hypothetical protein [Coraliihabitans acroporae]
MNIFTRYAVIAGAVALPLAVQAASSPVVIDQPSCERAIADAREAMAAASISDKARKTGEELIDLSSTRCADKNYEAADDLLAIVRGIAAEE